MFKMNRACIIQWMLGGLIVIHLGCSSSANPDPESLEVEVLRTDSVSQTTPANTIEDTVSAGINEDPNGWIKIGWQHLTDVAFEEKFVEEEQIYFLFPKFGPEVKKLEGKTLYISGYVIPIELDKYVLSANNFSSCFFCGGAGPETIIQLDFNGEPPRKYFTDEWRTFKGKFVLNGTDINKLNYILEGAEEYEVLVRSLSDSP